MIHITFMASSNIPGSTTQEVACDVGQTLMEAALAANVTGIDADCGGSLSCGTCHVYVAAPWNELIPAPDSEETQMLESVAAPRSRGSRLSCQIRLDARCDGMIIAIPERQT